MEQARAPLYMFTHKLLPSILYSSQENEILSRLKTFNSEVYLALEKLWNNLKDSDESLKNSYLDCEYIKEEEILLIKMPKEKYTLEAKYIGISFKDDIKYYVLELGNSFDENDNIKLDRYFLCTWNKDGTHSNLGELGAEKENFIEKIKEI